MKKIFMQITSGLGPVTRILPIAQELKKNGYDIRYAGYPNTKKFMDTIDVLQLNENFTLSDIKKGKPNPKYQTAEEFWEMIGYKDEKVTAFKVEELIKSVVSFSPDIIIADLGFISWIVSRILDIPLVMISQSCYHPDRFSTHIRWWENEDIQNKKLTLLKWLNEYLHSKGKKGITKFEEVCTGHLTLIPSYKEIDKLNGDRFNTKFTGPILFEPTENIENFAGIFPEKTTKPNIFCYTGRFYDNAGITGEYIFKEVVNAFSKLDVNLIVSVGGESELEIAKNMIKASGINSTNLIIIDFIPMNIAYKKSDIIIHHGGHGSCLGQIQYEKPSLIIPTHTEREYNAHMLEKLGFCEILPKDDLKADNIINKFNKLSKSNHYRLALKNFHNQVKDKPNFGVKAATAYIEDFLSQL